VCVLLHVSHIRIAEQNFGTNIFVRSFFSKIRTQDASLQEGAQGYITVNMS
jgi:hypothetical protein